MTRFRFSTGMYCYRRLEGADLTNCSNAVVARVPGRFLGLTAGVHMRGRGSSYAHGFVDNRSNLLI